MHIPDGFINAPVSAAAGVVAIGALAVCLRGARRELDEQTAPLAGLVAVFVFAAQMLNFPVAAGTSGHFLGGAMAAILVGPYAGALAVSVVLVIQGLVFADGGLSALGLNIINMGMVSTLAGYGVFLLVRKLLLKTKTGIVAAAAVAAYISVPASAFFFVLEYAIGGAGTFSFNQVLAAMVGVHAFIGIGEAVITALVISAILAVRPDLVYGARGLLPNLELRPALSANPSNSSDSATETSSLHASRSAE